MTRYAGDISWQVVSIFGNTCLFTKSPVRRDSVPRGFYLYEVRHDCDDWGKPTEITESAGDNLYGTILTPIPFAFKYNPLAGAAYTPLNSYLDIEYSGVRVRLKEVLSNGFASQCS